MLIGIWIAHWILGRSWDELWLVLMHLLWLNSNILFFKSIIILFLTALVFHFFVLSGICKLSFSFFFIINFIFFCFLLSKSPKNAAKDSFFWLRLFFFYFLRFTFTVWNMTIFIIFLNFIFFFGFLFSFFFIFWK